MNLPYCLPIIKNDKNQILETIERQKDSYAYFEIWLDYVDDLGTAFLQKLTNDLQDRLVVVFRRQELAPMQMSFEQRCEIIDLLHDTRALVDLDIATHMPEIEYFQRQNIKLRTIVSYHNYEETPDLPEILQQISKHNPEILKIATKCQNEKDALRLLDTLITLKQTKQKYIILGMGEQGLITRIFGPLWGNELVFAPRSSSEQSAPGQLTKDQLDKITEIIGE